MKYALLLLLWAVPTCFASDSQDIQLLNGKWLCEIELTEDGIDITGHSNEHYNATTMTYESISKANFFFNNELIATLNYTESGNWQYKDKRFYYLADTVNLAVELDIYNMLTKDAIADMQEEILNDRAPVVTRSLSEVKWVSFDESIKNESVCTRQGKL